MSDKESGFYENFSKDVFETIKGLSHDEQRSDFIISTYENLYGRLKDADNSTGVKVDLDKLREDLSHLRGIGGQRLDEIMAVIVRHLNGANEGKHEVDIGRSHSTDASNAPGEESETNSAADVTADDKKEEQ